MISIIDSIGFVEAGVFFSRPPIPRRVRGESLLQTLAQRCRRTGMGVLQLASEGPQAVQGERVVIACPRASQPRLYGGPVAFGEMIEHVAFLLTDTALHRHGAEDLSNGRPQGL
jgi:hypothetical protein